MEYKTSFVRSDRVILIHADQMGGTSGSGDSSIGLVRYLNFILSELVIKDCFKLKRYCFSTQLLKSISIDPFEREGTIDFCGGTPNFSNPRIAAD
jgi:hypothetical protein